MDSRPRYFRQRTTEVYLGIKAIPLCFQDHLLPSYLGNKIEENIFGL